MTLEIDGYRLIRNGESITGTDAFEPNAGRVGNYLDMSTVVTVDFSGVRVTPLICPRIIILLWVIIHQIALTVALGDLSPKKL